MTKNLFFRCIENQYKNDEINDENFTKVPLKVSIHWPYLHQDARKTWLEISKMKYYGKYSKATICRNMVKNISDLVPVKRAILWRAMVWRKAEQGLDFGLTSNGSHEGTGESVAHFMAAIAYEKGVIAVEQ